MKIIKRELRNRNTLMVHCSSFFGNFGISSAAKNNFTNVIAEGDKLNDLLRTKFLMTDLLKIQIVNYVVASYETIYAAAIEITDDHCEVIEILEDFRDQGLLIIQFINGSLDDSMFN